MSDEPKKRNAYIDANPFFDLTREQAEKLANELSTWAEYKRRKIIEESNIATKELADKSP